MWQLSKKAYFSWKFLWKRIFGELSNKVESIFLELFQQNSISFIEVPHKKNMKLGGDFETKQQTCWLTFPPNQQNSQKLPHSNAALLQGFLWLCNASSRKIIQLWPTDSQKLAWDQTVFRTSLTKFLHN